jgi:hypothetical protein
VRGEGEEDEDPRAAAEEEAFVPLTGGMDILGRL